MADIRDFDTSRRFEARVTHSERITPEGHIEEVRHIVERACGLAEIAERGFILLACGTMDTLTASEWESWLAIFSRARELKA